MPEMTEELPEKSVKRIEETAISLKKITQLEEDLEEMKKDKEVEMRQLAANMFEIEANLTEKIANLKVDLVSDLERNRDWERKNDDLEAQLSDQNVERGKGKAKIGELEGKINALQSTISDLETQITREQNETKDKDFEMSQLTAKVAQIETDLMGKIAETKRKNDDLEAQLRTQNTELKDGKAKIGELEGKINALQSKNSDLETHIQFERENKTAEIKKLICDLNLMMNWNSELDGWSYFEKTASWYKVIDQKMTFDEAVAYCASRKGHLVSIHSKEENDYVWELAKTVHSYNWFWIGLKRDPNKGNAFEWTDGSWSVGETPVDMSMWCTRIGMAPSGRLSRSFVNKVARRSAHLVGHWDSILEICVRYDDDNKRHCP
ncbi:unnamed protein product, partial [Mesorhabditis belari]|uniref:C-type lectin domain-containing protein n=1 Tax=Mesorhabditis belari TaxID=2138241 RepID=A0AAF3EQB9_9BILA